jgi:hypothetical protein
VFQKIKTKGLKNRFKWLHSNWKAAQEGYAAARMLYVGKPRGGGEGPHGMTARGKCLSGAGTSGLHHGFFSNVTEFTSHGPRSFPWMDAAAFRDPPHPHCPRSALAEF